MQVEEGGIEAAAATAVVTKDAIVETPSFDVEFSANRPFIHLITHKSSGSILFMGRLSLPESDMEWAACSEDDLDCVNPVYTIPKIDISSASLAQPFVLINLVAVVLQKLF